MPTYRWKQIRPVPTANDFIDIILSRTQRRTPTIVHPQYAIGRIRSFYMRKVSFVACGLTAAVATTCSLFFLAYAQLRCCTSYVQHWTPAFRWSPATQPR